MKKKAGYLICQFALIVMLVMITNSCKKDENKQISIPGPNVTDNDGNVYHSVILGTQCWMVENLKTTKYRDGTPIPNITDNTVWRSLKTGAYCDYDNNASNSTIYGKLYNWYAVSDSHNIAPKGWHVPTITEWVTLETYLGGSSIAGGKLKETDTTHWQSPNTGATNETGFTALPGGCRSDNYSFEGIRTNGIWWSSSESKMFGVLYEGMIYNNSNLYGNNYQYLPKIQGFSVRW